MLNLRYYSEELVDLAQVESIVRQVGFPVMFIKDDINWLHIEIEPMTVVRWEILNWEEFELEEKEDLLSKQVKTVHLITLHYHIAPKLREFLSLLFSKYAGWVVDDETPNFSDKTKGRVDIYNGENVNEFLKTLSQ